MERPAGCYHLLLFPRQDESNTRASTAIATRTTCNANRPGAISRRWCYRSGPSTDSEEGHAAKNNRLAVLVNDAVCLESGAARAVPPALLRLADQTPAEAQGENRQAAYELDLRTWIVPCMNCPKDSERTKTALTLPMKIPKPYETLSQVEAKFRRA